MDFEKALEKVLAEAKKYQKAAVGLDFESLKDDNVLTSKLLGTPYWESGVKIPLNSEGNPLQMMAQINLKEFPKLPDLPEKGILQFFVDPISDLYGLNFDEPIDHKSSKVIYWADPSIEKYKAYPYEEMSCSPINVPLRVKPKEIRWECCGASDEYHFDQYCRDIVNKYEEYEDDIMDHFYSEDNSGSKLGGYAYFTQSDPRAYDNKALYKTLGCKREDNKEFVLLLQLDSDHEEMMWGDVGVANWFILKEDLEKLDFSKVLYNWDCC